MFSYSSCVLGKGTSWGASAGLCTSVTTAGEDQLKAESPGLATFFLVCHLSPPYLVDCFPGVIVPNLKLEELNAVHVRV
jgi:hypothetical protein